MSRYTREDSWFQWYGIQRGMSIIILFFRKKPCDSPKHITTQSKIISYTSKGPTLKQFQPQVLKSIEKIYISVLDCNTDHQQTQPDTGQYCVIRN